MVLTEKIVYEEVVVEVKLHDVACPGSAVDAAPPAAVLATPWSQPPTGVTGDASFEGEQRIPLSRDAAAVGCLFTGDRLRCRDGCCWC